ncbi:uncharacterized protein G2W53_001010 [Senna tora]|uniref:Uncharacterized protein n=1 Tax=Senna tora TaxID=362788 RepID=A0A834XES2_9FABA|nr:uncharacterized protein G2W53_001010 [Senna tora]
MAFLFLCFGALRVKVSLTGPILPFFLTNCSISSISKGVCVSCLDPLVAPPTDSSCDEYFLYSDYFPRYHLRIHSMLFPNLVADFQHLHYPTKLVLHVASHDCLEYDCYDYSLLLLEPKAIGVEGMLRFSRSCSPSCPLPAGCYRGLELYLIRLFHRLSSSKIGAILPSKGHPIARPYYPGVNSIHFKVKPPEYLPESQTQVECPAHAPGAGLRFLVFLFQSCTHIATSVTSKLESTRFGSLGNMARMPPCIAHGPSMRILAAKAARPGGGKRDVNRREEGVLLTQLVIGFEDGFANDFGCNDINTLLQSTLTNKQPDPSNYGRRRC